MRASTMMRCTYRAGTRAESSRTRTSMRNPSRVRASSSRDDALDAVNTVLTILRKNNLPALRAMVARRGPVTTVGGDREGGSRLLQHYREGGVLLDFTDVFDLGSRRLLPSNLLRRSQVLSVMQQRGRTETGGYLVRMKVTAKSGEEGTVLWELSASNQLISCIESSEDGDACSTVHPRHSPDAVLASYMTAMQRQDFIGAQEFCARNDLYEGLELGTLSRFDTAYRRALQDFFVVPDAAGMPIVAPYHTIANSEEWLLADGVLLDQSRMVREVVVRATPGDWYHWAVELAICQNGCWMIDGIRFLK